MAGPEERKARARTGDSQRLVGEAVPDVGEMRGRISAAAEAIARTEDRVADNLERLALCKAQASQCLMAKAAQARSFAARLRQLATSYDDNSLGSESDP